MRIFRALIYGVCFGLLTPCLSFAKGWNGIEPLQSSSSDVTNRLGPPTKQILPGTYFYDLRDKDVFIEFSEGSCVENGPEGWRVTPGTVVNILVAPKSKLLLNARVMDESKYKKKEDEHWGGHVFYSDVEGGEVFETYNGILLSVTYTPGAKYSPLRCYGSGKEWMDAVGIGCVLPRKFDEFVDLELKGENASWDNLALQLQSDPFMIAYIVVHPGRGRSNEAQARVRRAKKYLSKRGIKDWRILTVSAETTENLSFELWVWPLGAFGPYV